MNHPGSVSPAIAILGADTVVGRALCVRLDHSGYDTIPVDAYPTGVVDELLDGADLLLVVSRLDEGAREAFLGAMGNGAPQRGEMPVILLSTTTTAKTISDRGVLSLPWPCPLEDLVDHIEASLSRRHLPLNGCS